MGLKTAGKDISFSRTAKGILNSRQADFAVSAAAAARKALETEALAAPKPGLVDRFDRGAHRDMDISTLLGSAKVLEVFFEKMYYRGFEEGGCGTGKPLSDPRGAFHRVRTIGVEAEKAMFRATRGVNTHKGAIFTLGLLGTSLGYLRGSGGDENDAPVTAEKVMDCAAKMVEGIVERELASRRKEGCGGVETAGERLYRLYGIRGIRGEAEDAFPALRKTGLPVLAAERGYGGGADDYCVQTLLHLMTVVEDTNVAARGGPEALRIVRKRAQEVLDAGGIREPEGRRLLGEMNRDFVEGNISPGGSADLLAAAIFLDSLELSFS
jgi:triphosphoribosyl-dephospho-CoA synthase